MASAPDRATPPPSGDPDPARPAPPESREDRASYAPEERAPTGGAGHQIGRSAGHADVIEQSRNGRLHATRMATQAAGAARRRQARERMESGVNQHSPKENLPEGTGMQARDAAGKAGIGECILENSNILWGTAATLRDLIDRERAVLLSPPNGGSCMLFM